MIDQKTHIKNLSKRLYPLILGIGIPASLRTTAQYVQQLIDVMYIGQYDSVSLTALSSISLPIWLFDSFWFGLGMSTTVMVAQRLGAKKMREAAVVAKESFYIGAVLSLLYVAAWFALPSPIVRLMNLPPAAAAEALAYLGIFKWIYLVRILLYIIPACVLEAHGLTRVLMTASLLQSAINIILDPIFIWPLGMGIRGAALATIIAEVCGGIVISGYFWKKNILQLRTLKNLRLKWHTKERLLLALPQAGMNFSWSFVSSFTISLMNRAIPMGSAIFNVTFLLSDFTYRMLLGFDSAVTSLVGRSFGAKRLDRIKAILRSALVMNTLYGTALVAIMVLFRVPLIRLFTSDPYIRESILANFPWLITLMIETMYAGIFISTLHAMGKSRWNLAAGITADAVRLSVTYLTVNLWGWGMPGAFSAIMAQEAVRYVLTISIILIYLKRYQKLWDAHARFRDDKPVLHLGQDDQHPFR